MKCLYPALNVLLELTVPHQLRPVVVDKPGNQTRSNILFGELRGPIWAFAGTLTGRDRGSTRLSNIH